MPAVTDDFLTDAIDRARRALDNVRAVGIENVHFKIFDGTYGWGEFAPYRAIVVTAGHTNRSAAA